MTFPEILHQFDSLDKNSPQFPDQLTNLLYKEGLKEYILKFRDEDVVWLVEYLDRVLGSLDPSSPPFRKCLSELGWICGTREKLPHWYILEGSLSIPSRHPVASGGSGDVYEGVLEDSRVCVKRLRIYAKGESRTTKKTFHREAVMWRRLTHPNIVPLLGVTLEPLQLISAWIPGGELKEYIVNNPATDRLALLSGIADGLNYLHSRNMVHGDLKGPNILVDDSGCPRITDFGLAMVTQNQDSVRSAQGEHAHTARWTAPEILNEEGTYSKEADVFSFAMVMVETFTGEVPFHNNPTAAAILAILDEKRPARPTHPSLTSELWTLMQRCWNQDPHLRPEMSSVLKTLRGSDLSPDKPFPRKLATVFTSSQTLIEPMDQQTAKHSQSPKLPPSSKDWEQSPSTEASSSGSGSTQIIFDSSQTVIHNPIRSGSNSHRSEEQGEESSGPTVQNQSQSRRGTDQSELYTPLPVDPVQVDSNQRPDWTGKPHINLLDSLGKIDATREEVDSSRIGGNSRNAGGISHASAGLVFTLPVPNQTGDGHGSTSRNPSRSHSTNNLRNLNQSRHNLQDVGTTGGEILPEDPSTNSHSSPPPSQPKPVERAGIPSGQVSKQNHTHKDRNGEQGTRQKLERAPVTPSAPENRGIWSRIMRKLRCISDEHTSA